MEKDAADLPADLAGDRFGLLRFVGHPEECSGKLAGMASITLLNRYGFHQAIVFGFEIQADRFPVILGCTARNYSKREIDFKAQKVDKPGKLLVHMSAPASTAAKGMSQIWWEGDVLMALWPDMKMEKRLTDTGWIHWRAEYLIGSSIKGVEMQEDEMRARYKDAQRIRFKEE